MQRRSKAAMTVTAAMLAAAALALSGCSALGAFVPGFGGGSAESTLMPGGQAPVDLPETPAGTVAGMGQQQPNWRDCAKAFQCADVYAPLDWNEPAGELITLRLVKHEATGKNPIGTLFVNPGGPGASGANYLAGNLDYSIPREIQERYDVVAWDPRGVGASSPVTCLDSAEMDEYLFGLGDEAFGKLEQGSPEWIAAVREESQAFGAACQKSTGALLGHVSTDDTVQDLDMLRAVVGDDTLHYLGFSYGTYIGARYADAYPESVGRLVLDGAMDPSATMVDVVREQTRGFELALRAYVTDCLTRRDCPLGGTVDEAMQQVSWLLDTVDAEPIEGSDGRFLTANTFLTAIITPLYAESNWGYLDQLFASVANGNGDIGLALADSYFDRSDGEYLTNSTEAFSAVNCLDYPEREVDAAQMKRDSAELIKIAPTIGRFQGYGELSCADWPVESSSTRGPVAAVGAAPILVVGTTGDPATPFRWAEALAQQLDSGVLLTYQGEGHTAYGESNCADEIINAYLLEGEVPAEGVVCTQ